MRGIFDGRAPRRVLAVVAVSGLGVLSAAGIASAGGSASQAPGDTATVTAEFQQGRLFFSPRNISISSGGRLTINNGRPGIPHSLTLVREALLPKTRRQRRQCYNPGQICFRALSWHRALDNNNANDLDRVDVRRPGFDTPGGLRRTGDSIFFNRRSRSVVVSAPAGTTLPFLCFFHPWMQGHINVE